MKERIKSQVRRWRRDYMFKTIIAAVLSFCITVMFALYNGYIGIISGSVWHGSICVYYLFLVFIRGLILLSERRCSALDEPAAGKLRRRTFIYTGVVLMLMHAALCVPISLMVLDRAPVNVGLIPSIAMATYTTYKVIAAEINMRKARRNRNVLVRELRLLTFIEALVSVLTLQNTLIAVNGGGEDMLALTSVTSAGILVLIIVSSIVSFCRGLKEM